MRLGFFLKISAGFKVTFLFITDIGYLCFLFLANLIFWLLNPLYCMFLFHFIKVCSVTSSSIFSEFILLLLVYLDTSSSLT